MTIDQILELGKMGFTKEDIISLTATQSQIAADKIAEKPAEKQEAKPEVKQEAKQEVKFEEVKQPEALSKIDEAINKLVNAATTLQQTAIANSQQPETQSTDDILSQMLTR